MHGTKILEEADRLLTVCNSCRYCEGLCAVFPAMEMRRAFSDGDLNYLANLCHGCGACYDDCQFSPPHEFDVNVPKILAQVRAAMLRGPVPVHAFDQDNNQELSAGELMLIDNQIDQTTSTIRLKAKFANAD